MQNINHECYPESAVLLVTFNRPDYTRQVIDSLRRAEVMKLYIFKDGPRAGNMGDIEAHKELLSLFQEIDWPCDCLKYISDVNLGCGVGVSTAITWAFENEDRLIILEDDCVAAKSFYPFCNQMLEMYKDDQRVWVVSGENKHFPDWGFKGADYLFSVFGYNWGWGTWKRCWEFFDFDLKKLPQVLEEKVFYSIFCDKKIADTYHRRFVRHQAKSGVHSFWLLQFGLQLVLHRGLSIIPRQNLIKNIGIDGIHTSSICQYHNIETSDNFAISKHPHFVIADHKLMKWHYNKRIRYHFGDVPVLHRAKKKVLNTAKKLWSLALK